MVGSIEGKSLYLGARPPTSMQLNLSLPRRSPMERTTSVLGDSAFEQNKHAPIHRWVPWIAGFSARFVEDAFRHYLPDPERRDVEVLEPFAGVGTTLVEGLLHGYNVTGFEVNPFAALASRVKCSAFLIDPERFRRFVSTLVTEARHRTEGIDQAFDLGISPHTLSPVPASAVPPGFRSRTPFFSPYVERKVLHCIDLIRAEPEASMRELATLALGAVLVQVSNYSYEPSLGSRAAAGKPDIPNADVVLVLADKLTTIYEDLVLYRERMGRFATQPSARLIERSSLDLAEEIAPRSIDLVVTSPPYVNNYHYIRNTRPHLYWLDFVSSPRDLHGIERANFGKYWQTVRDAKPQTLCFDHQELNQIVSNIAAMNPEKGVYGGQGWANYAVEYFNDCFRMCQALRYALKPGGVAIYVIGNSIMQGFEVPTDRFFGEIGERCGLTFETLHLLRAKRTGASVIASGLRSGPPEKATLYETAVVLRQPMNR